MHYILKFTRKNIKARNKQDGGVWPDSDLIIITGDFAFDLMRQQFEPTNKGLDSAALLPAQGGDSEAAARMLPRLTCSSELESH